MKKILAILALAFASTAFADSATVEYQNIDNRGAADQRQFVLGVKHDFTKAFTGDVAFSNAQTDGTHALSTRLEGGLTASAPLGLVTGYVRGAVGEKFTNSTSFTYYSIEPGITAPVGPVTVKVGYRFRSAVDSGLNNDQTHAVRAGVSYALTKVDTVGIRYDRVRGDNTQNIVAVGYTRGF